MTRSAGPKAGRRRHSPRRVAPRPTWLLLALVLGTFWCLLLADGLVRPYVGIDVRGADRHGSIAQVPDSVLDGGSVIRWTGGEFRSLTIPDKTVVLTFDDGPDAEWTPRILNVLQRHRVPATFFVLGAHAAEHPGLIQQIRQAGAEIGNHTFSHPDLVDVTPARLRYELSQTQLAIVGATGQVTYLVRPPYSSSPSALEDAQLPMLRELSAGGYVIALSDIDSRDWERPGVDAIVEAATPRGGRGGAILLHDSGGDRSQTVAALDRLIPLLQQQGYTFTTITQAVGLPTAERPADPASTAVGVALLITVSVATRLVPALQWALIAVGALVALRLLIMVVVAGRHRRQRGSNASRSARCGCCRCSRSSTGNSCTPCSSARRQARSPECACPGRSCAAGATSPAPRAAVCSRRDRPPAGHPAMHRPSL
jgi:peptidoglycan/xylan/chitin deacetylase (PgdA/CDA1 family)